MRSTVTAVRIVISFLRMVGFGGTETYVLTVAGELERLGHDVVIYAPETGPYAEFGRAHGARIVNRISELPAECDAVFAQDASTAYTMARHYPDAARVFVAHSASLLLQSPPQVEDVCRAVVVMNDRLQRHVDALAFRPEVIRLRQPIDLQRFWFSALNLEQRRPPRALALGNCTQGTRARMIKRACEIAGLELRRVGATTAPTSNPERAIAEAEIVITIGRGALEAMASGRATYVFGNAGGDGWVTAETYPALERDGFSGRALGEAIGLERLADDLTHWSEEMGEVGRDLVCSHHDVEQHAVALIDIARGLEKRPSRPPEVVDELARLVRLEWDRSMRVREAVAETADARAQAAAARAELTAARERVAELEHALAQACELPGELAQARSELARVLSELTRFQATRRYRLASLIARPLDELRAARRSRAPGNGRPRA